MRVTFLAVTYPPSVGGAQLYVQRVAEGLAERGHRVEVVTTDALRSPAGRDPGRVGPPEEERDGVAVHRLPLARRTHAAVRAADRARGRVRSGARPPHPARLGPFGARLARAAVAAGRRSDAVVGCVAPFTTVVAPPLVARGGAAAVAAPLLHLGAHVPPRAVQRALARCHGVAALTTYERDAMAGFGVAPDRVAVLPPGADPDRVPDLPAAEARRRAGLPERPTVGYVGRLAAYKGIDTLLDAARRLWAERPELTVVVAGAGAGWDHLDVLVERARRDAGERLVVRRDLAPDEKDLLVAACDVVAFPSREESYGIATTEAWCARRPVVAADIAAVRCVIDAGTDGDLVPVGDDAALAAAVGALLDDPVRARRYGEAGRRRAERELAWDHIVAGWDDLLAAAVARRRGKAGTYTGRLRLPGGSAGEEDR